jgi:hypothetical protein
VRGGEPPSVASAVDAAIDDVEDEVVEVFFSSCLNNVVEIFFSKLSAQSSGLQTAADLFDLFI